MGEKLRSSKTLKAKQPNPRALGKSNSAHHGRPRELWIASIEYAPPDSAELAVRLKRAFDLLGLEGEILRSLADSQSKSKMKENSRPDDCVGNP